MKLSLPDALPHSARAALLLLVLWSDASHAAPKVLAPRFVRTIPDEPAASPVAPVPTATSNATTAVSSSQPEPIAPTGDAPK